MTKDEALKLALEALRQNRRNHYYCEDQWYSCPKHEDGCFNEAEGDECNCGADKANQEIDFAITALRQALEHPYHIAKYTEEKLQAVQAAIKAENEACAKIVDAEIKLIGEKLQSIDERINSAIAIRARMNDD